LKELDIPELVSKMQEAVRARAMEMLEATGLPVQQLLAQVSSFTSLLDSVKELALGRVQGSTLSKEELMDKARALLDQLPSVSDMQALKPAELMAKVVRMAPQNGKDFADSPSCHRPLVRMRLCMQSCC
jgi:hypothetical protein